jgi:hypothetical protein
MKNIMGNSLTLFLEECCDVFPGVHSLPIDVWRAYCRWCADGKNRPVGRWNFCNEILRLVPHAYIKHNKKCSFVGLALNNTGIKYMENGKRFDKSKEEE